MLSDRFLMIKLIIIEVTLLTTSDAYSGIQYGTHTVASRVLKW